MPIVAETPLKRARLRAYVNTIADMIAEVEAGNSISRQWVVEKLRRSLEEARVEPFRGIRHSEDVYEKELTSVYIVATRIMRLPFGRLSGIFEEVFSSEINLDRVTTVVKRRGEPGETRSAVESYLGRADEANLSRIIRFLTTEYYLDLIGEDEAVRSVRNLVRAYPELSDKFGRMTKFFVAVVVGSKIATDEIRAAIDMEARKKAIAISLGLSRGAPSDEYLVDVAKIVYGNGGSIRRLAEVLKNRSTRFGR